jgi:hypothetical protein
MRRIILCVVFLSLLEGLSAKEALPYRTSLIALLGNPSAFDNKPVIVTGYVCSDGGAGYGLFLTRSDCADVNYSNGIRLNVSRLSKAVPSSASLLTVEGRFKDWSQYVHTDEPFDWGEIEVRNISGRSMR